MHGRTSFLINLLQLFPFAFRFRGTKRRWILQMLFNLFTVKSIF
eukprot:UN13838